MLCLTSTQSFTDERKALITPRIDSQRLRLLLHRLLYDSFEI
jgi:hypothetical protein